MAIPEGVVPETPTLAQALLQNLREAQIIVADTGGPLPARTDDIGSSARLAERTLLMESTHELSGH